MNDAPSAQPQAAVRIKAADPMTADLLRVDLERRSVAVAREPDGTLVARADTPDRVAAIHAALERLPDRTGITVDGLPSAPPASSGARAGSYAIVIAPPVERRQKWTIALKRMGLQISRDAPYQLDQAGEQFAVRGIPSEADAQQACEAIRQGMLSKLNLEVDPVLVPDNCAPLLMAVEQDRRSLTQQLGYGIDSSALIQVAVRDDQARQALAAQIEASGTRVATADDRLLVGMPSKQAAQDLIKQLSLPDHAAVQITQSTFNVTDLVPRGLERHSGSFDSGIGYLFWEATQGELFEDLLDAGS